MMNNHLIDGITTARVVPMAIAVVFGAICPILAAADREAASQVREGVRLHQAGEFAQAAEVFAKAAKALPDDPRVAFNQGSALAAQGKHEEAESLLRSAALARDKELASAAYYNLGCLVAEQVQALFGDQPEEAVDPTREEGLLLVRTAVDHYRQALRVNPDHAGARHNLELLRIWSKHIQDRWAERDRERRREAMNVLEYLQWLKVEQRGVRAEAMALPLTLNSPRLRQTVRKLSNAQRELILEVEPLKAKLDQALQPPQEPVSPTGAGAASPPAATPPLSPEMQQVQKILQALADQAGVAMQRAAGELADRNTTGAVEAQTEVLPPLNQLFEFVAPFEAILQAAIESETKLVTTSQEAATAAEETPHSPPTAPDVEDAAEEQRFVSGWAGMLVRKAEQLLSESQPETPESVSAEGGPTEIPLPLPEEGDRAETPDDDPEPAAASSNDEPAKVPEPNESAPAGTVASESPPVGGPTPDAISAESTDEEAEAKPPANASTHSDAELPAEPPADPQAAYQKAVELGPRIKKLTGQAAEDLQQQDWAAALPKQEEALELLKEIAALLPPDEQQQDDQQQEDQENQDDKNQDDKNQDDKNQDEDQQGNSSDDEQQKQQDQDQSEQKQQPDDADKDGDQQESEEDQGKSQPDGQSKESQQQSREQAESMLRQVREREREHREFEKEIRRLLRSRIIVEKDW